MFTSTMQNTTSIHLILTPMHIFVLLQTLPMMKTKRGEAVIIPIPLNNYTIKFEYMHTVKVSVKRGQTNLH